MDAFSVSITIGIFIKKADFRIALKVALFFGLFQAIMPLFGWVIGQNVSSFISKIDHWVAFLLLTLIGIHMIYESSEKDTSYLSSTNFYMLLLLSIATSIDAFAVGIGFALLNTSIIYPAIIIGLITFILSFFGVFFGSKIGKRLKSKSQILGGVILLLIGLKIIIDHTI